MFISFQPIARKTKEKIASREKRVVVENRLKGRMPQYPARVSLDILNIIVSLANYNKHILYSNDLKT